ncbi:peptidoglycan-binding protein [Alsobacter soli]|uniref:Peptidoglycan-binding protein n=1 Tax=Alsobacter soli TaxID=2109933 RepID=A0A2T1HMD0_9HYPH|nr:LysM peptidoglycan-binding domain-containing protein [Alsobacter soli]PSC02751.1 peptidoglycan-binding protein [Alsobacter soli]
MVGWVKGAALVIGFAAVGAAIAVFGLPTNLTRNASVTTSVPSAAPAGLGGSMTSVQTAPSPSGAPAAGQASQEAKAPPSAPQIASLSTQEPAKPTPKVSPEAPAVPSFDVVRVEPAGDSVVAGRAAPGSTVELLRNGQALDRAAVDASGRFAMTPPRLPAGAHDLTLQVTLPDGTRQVSTQSVTVSVPDTPTGEVVVALTAPDKPTEILSRTPPANPAPNAPAGVNPPAKLASAAPAPGAGPRSRVLLQTVEAEEGGKLFATGQAAAGASVRLYLNDTFLATAKAGTDGKWSFTISKGLEPGAYKVRVDDVDSSDGKVLSRAEAPFDYTAKVAALGNLGAVAAVTPTGPAVASAEGRSLPAQSTPGQATGATGGGKPAQVAATAATEGANVVVPEIRTTMVGRGDSLWRISKKIYGKGQRYTVIYDANQAQIRDADLIYPGQLFVLPGDRTN